MSSTDDARPPPETLEPHSRVDSSSVNLDNNEENPSSTSPTNLQDPELMSSDALARAISSTLGSLIREFDSKAENTTKSQDQLSSAIDRLTGELDQLLEDAPLPFIMQHASKISGVRKRVSSLNFLLKSIQRRIDNIDRIMSTGLSHDLIPILLGNLEEYQKSGSSDWLTTSKRKQYQEKLDVHKLNFPCKTWRLKSSTLQQFGAHGQNSLQHDCYGE